VKVTGADIIAVMKEGGINPDVVNKLKFDAPLVDQGLDSMDLPVIAAATEKKFGIDLSDADAIKLRTVNDFVAFVNQKFA
jgi:acyl carrier protein